MARSTKAEVEVTATSKNLGARLREARSKFGAFAGELKKNVFGKDMMEKGFWGKGGAQMVGNLGSSAASSAGGYIADQAKGVWSYNDALTRLQITAEKTPEEMKAFSVSVKEASDRTGIGKDKILAASAAYVALTGDMDGAAKSTGMWANVAQATNSSIDDIAKTAAALSQNSKVGPEDMEAAFAALAIQGKKGAIELKDLASQMSTIAPQWAMFKGGTGVEGVKQLGAALQIVKRGFGGDAGETITGLQGMLTALVKNSARFKAGGVKIFDTDKNGNKTMRNVLDIVNDISNSKLVKDPQKLEKAFGRVEAYRAFIQLRENKGALDDLIKTSGDVGVIQRDLGTYMQSDAGRVGVAYERMKNAIADAFTPERINAFVNAVEALADKIGPVVDAVGKIGGALGSIYGAGQTMRGWVSGGGHKSYDKADQMAGVGFGAGNSDEERAHRREAGSRNMRAVDTYNSTVDQIMGRERGDKSTPESVQRAVMAVYNGRNKSDGSERGERDAGSAYLENAHVDAQQYVQNELKKTGGELAPELLKQLQGLQAAITLLAGAGTTVSVGGDAVAKANKNAPVNRTRPRG
jgi:hypothetical protein